MTAKRPPMSSPAASPACVLVLYSIVEQMARGQAYELLADADTLETAAAITAALIPTFPHVAATAIRTAAEVAPALARYSPSDTVILNLCEGLGGVTGAENQIPPILDAQGFAYVGGDADNLAACLDKYATKQRLAAAGLPTAAAQLFPLQESTSGRDRIGEPLTLSFPLLVKTLYEDCSVGLNPNSLVWDEPALRAQVAYVHATYHQPALVERFLRGREFYVSLWNDEHGSIRVLAIAQGDYSSAPDPSLAFDHFEAKWQGIYPSICPAPIDAALWQRISDTARAAYRLMGCRDYARVDLREDGDEVYILEVNPNPALHPTAGFAKAARWAGYDYPTLAATLIQRAWQRHTHKA
jgi:D-alanine-D-alanine ligase